MAPPTAPMAAPIGPPVRPMTPPVTAPAAAAPPVVAWLSSSWRVLSTSEVISIPSSSCGSMLGEPAFCVPRHIVCIWAGGMTAESSNPVESAAAAGLRYVNDEGPGIRRQQHGKAFSYYSPDGELIRDRQVIQRIKALVIPPAWTDVWICPDPDGHIQATGRDARERKQYRYHPRWHEVRDAAKYERLEAFAQAPPQIRDRVEADLRAHGLPRRKVLALVVKLLQDTSIRIGNDEYRRENRSFALTTMLDRHARFEAPSVRFEFKRKSGRLHSVRLTDRRLARLVKQCLYIPGQALF